MPASVDEKARLQAASKDRDSLPITWVEEVQFATLTTGIFRLRRTRVL